MLDLLLLCVILFPCFGIFVLFFVSNENYFLIRFIGFSFSLFVFILSLFLWVFFDNSSFRFQFISILDWNLLTNVFLVLGLDGISIFFILLTTLLIPLCLLSSWSVIHFYVKEFFIAFLFLEFCLCLVFSVLDLLLFYIFFEAVLIPMFLVIGIWGSRTRKMKAAYQFFLYTLCGSLFMLLAIVFILFETGTTDLQVLFFFNNSFVLWSEERELFLWLAFFSSFAVKVPMVPFHIWLPEAHVEAPTAGSVLLAGVLLKLGTYGIIRFLLPLFPGACLFFTPLVYALSLVAIIYTSLTALRQVDLKKIIAYSSVAHMGFVTLGLFTFNIHGLEGAMLIMLSHGFVSSALFLCVGVLYDRFHTRLIKYYGGIADFMPLFTLVFVFFTLANLGFPGTSSFIGEFLVLLGICHFSFSACFFASWGMVLSAAYSLWLCNRVLFGSLLNSNFFLVFQRSDLTKREFAFFFPLIFLTLWMGLYPNIFLDVIHLSIVNLLFNF